MPAFRLATARSFDGITSNALGGIMELPWLYRPTDDPDVMRSWGVARADGDGSVAEWERIRPGCVVAPRYAGETASRGDLLYHGAELAAAFVKAS